MGREKKWSDAEILQLFLNADRPVLGTGEIAEATGYKPQHVSRRLDELESSGYLKSHKVGQVLVWWITFEGRQILENE